MITRPLASPRTVTNGGQTTILTHEMIFPPEEDDGDIRCFKAWMDDAGNPHAFGTPEIVQVNTPEKQAAIRQAIIQTFDQGRP